MARLSFTLRAPLSPKPRAEATARGPDLFTKALDREERGMLRAAFLIGLMAAWTPMAALAQDAPQPKYPPGFDCETLPAGEAREACRKSALDPTMDSDRDDHSLTGAGPETPGSVSPPTFPDEPGSETRDSGPGSSGGAGGVGN
jgi:hypothetical protein